jgi:hypothetical protein
MEATRRCCREIYLPTSSVLREMHVVQAVILLVIMATGAGATSERTGDKHYA